MTELICQCGNRYFVRAHKVSNDKPEQIPADAEKVIIFCSPCGAWYKWDQTIWNWHSPSEKPW